MSVCASQLEINTSSCLKYSRQTHLSGIPGSSHPAPGLLVPDKCMIAASEEPPGCLPRPVPHMSHQSWRTGSGSPLEGLEGFLQASG